MLSPPGNVDDAGPRPRMAAIPGGMGEHSSELAHACSSEYKSTEQVPGLENERRGPAVWKLSADDRQLHVEIG